MKTLVRVSASFVLLFFACVGAVQGAMRSAVREVSSAKAGLRLQLRSVRVVRLDRWGIQAQAVMTLVPTASAHVEAIQFRNMQVAGIAVTMSTIEGVELHRGQKTDLPPVQIAAAPGGVAAVKALVRVARYHSATLDGEVTLTVRPRPLQRLLLHSGQLRVVVMLHEEVPVDTAGLGVSGLSIPAEVGSVLRGMLHRMACFETFRE